MCEFWLNHGPLYVKRKYIVISEFYGRSARYSYAEEHGTLKTVIQRSEFKKRKKKTLTRMMNPILLEQLGEKFLTGRVDKSYVPP